jgi:hypothetical protein
VSYLIDAFLPTTQIPSPADARKYVIEGAYFDDIPTITIENADDGTFLQMEVRYAADRHPLVLRRLAGEDAEAARGAAADVAIACDREDIAKAIAESAVVLEWEIERSELDEDTWFAMRQWHEWVISRAGGWIYGPEDGIYDSDMIRQCKDQ